MDNMRGEKKSTTPWCSSTDSSPARRRLSPDRVAVRALLILCLGGPLVRADPQVLRHPHQIGQRIGTHLTHDVTAMKLDRELGYVELGRNLLIKEPANHLLHHFLLARA